MKTLRRLALTLPVVLACAFARADGPYKYDPFINRRESASPEAQFGYDRSQGTWRYMAPGTGAQYNPYSRRWEYPR